MRPLATPCLGRGQYHAASDRRHRADPARLGIDRAILFGGSWGATLALAYAEAHPESVAALVLRGVFLGPPDRAGLVLWRRRRAFLSRPLGRIPGADPGSRARRHDRRLSQAAVGGDRGQESRYALPWLVWENALAGLEISGPGHAPPDYARAFARLENHYFVNGCFLDEGQLLRDRHRIAHIPAVIVQGRYDMVCPPASAWELAEAGTGAELRIVPASGHALSEPRIAAELVRVMDGLRDAVHDGNRA